MADKLTEQEMKELRTVFAVLDKKNNGKIAHAELQTAMDQLGFKVKDDDIHQFISRASNKGTGVTEEQFVSWMHRVCQANVIHEAFLVLDSNKDGYISRSELRKGLVLMGENISDEMLDNMMQEADQDRDGRLNYQEFQKVMAQ